MSTHFSMISHNIPSMAVIDCQSQPMCQGLRQMSSQFSCTVILLIKSLMTPSLFSKNNESMLDFQQPQKHLKDVVDTVYLKRIWLNGKTNQVICRLFPLRGSEPAWHPHYNSSTVNLSTAVTSIFHLTSESLLREIQNIVCSCSKFYNLYLQSITNVWVQSQKVYLACKYPSIFTGLSLHNWADPYTKHYHFQALLIGFRCV